MNDEELKYDILIDKENSPIIIESECAELQPIVKGFLEAFAENKDKPVEIWLEAKMSEFLPDRTPDEIHQMSDEIITSITVSERKKSSLEKAITQGRSKENWFASETRAVTSAMSTQNAASYMAELDIAVTQANKALYNTITTQAGVVSKNPHLDGFIAEQYHVQTFNMNAEAAGSSYRAEVLEPIGNGYAKNSVDIVIKDGSGKTVRRYQSKYCKNAEATVQAYENGDYRGQRLLVPEGQETEIQRKCSTVIEAPDGTTSNPLSKSRAEHMRNEAQSGNWNDLNWNEYHAKDLAIGIGQQAGYAALQGAVIGVGFDVAKKLWNGEKIKGEEIVETALVSGADFGIKAAAAGALKVGAEKGVLSFIPKGTPASTLANVAFVAIENAKIIGKMATGELTAKEGIEKIEQTTISTAAGLVAMGKGATVGAAMGLTFGPVGAAVGGFIGGTVGYMAGSKVGETIVKGAQKLRDGAVTVVKKIGTGIKNAVNSFTSGVKNFVGGIKSLFCR